MRQLAVSASSRVQVTSGVYFDRSSIDWRLRDNIYHVHQGCCWSSSEHLSPNQRWLQLGIDIASTVFSMCHSINKPRLCFSHRSFQLLPYADYLVPGFFTTQNTKHVKFHWPRFDTQEVSRLGDVSEALTSKEDFRFRYTMIEHAQV